MEQTKCRKSDLPNYIPYTNGEWVVLIVYNGTESYYRKSHACNSPLTLKAPPDVPFGPLWG